MCVTWNITTGGVYTNNTLTGITDSSKAFIFNTCNRRTSSGTSDGVAVTLDADELGAGLKLLDDKTVEFTIMQGNTSGNNKRQLGFEIWEYTGPDGGANEFKVLGQYKVDLESVESASVTVSGVTNMDKCVCFINGITHNQGADAVDGLTAIAYLTDSTTMKVVRGAGANDSTYVWVTLVEFTGSNWSVIKASVQSGNDSGTITLPSSVTDWDNAFIYHQFKANSANHVDDAIADTSAVYYQDDNVLNEVYWAFHSDHVDSVGDSIHYVYVLENPNITVYREESTSNVNDYIDYFTTLSPKPSPNETSMMVSRYTSGTGTATPRGFSYSFYSGKHARTWCVYAGNTVREVVQLIHMGTENYAQDTTTYLGKVLETLPIDSFWTYDGNFIDYGSCEYAYNYHNLSICELTTPDDDDAAFTCRGQTHCLKISGGTGETMSGNLTYMLLSNSPKANFGTKTKRTLGGWFSLSKIQELFACIYKEGGGANNIAFLIGFGNMIMGQVDQSTGGVKYVQTYGDFPLSARRPYHVALVFEAQQDVKLYVDGILQERSFNNPYDKDYHPSHTGPIVYGLDGAIDSGGPDVEYYAPERCYYSGWFNVADVLTEEEIRFNLVEYGLPALVELAEDTAANMQTDLDQYAGLDFPDYPLEIRIPKPTDSEDLVLTANGQVMHERATYHIQWLGTGTLTIKNTNGANISKYSSLFGGTVNIMNSVHVMVKVYDIATNENIEDARIYFEELGRYETSDANGEVDFYEFINSGSTLTIRIRKGSSAPYYKPYKTSGIIDGDTIRFNVGLVKDS
jgi:hypothetical protein